MKEKYKLKDEGRGRNLGFSSKGQGILTKPIMILLFIVATIILINSIFSSINEARLRERESMIRTAASNVMLNLQSIDCLSYEGLDKKYTNVIDINKLNNFSQLYSGVEPYCARNFDYGWRATVTEKDKQGNSARSWSLGASNFSSGKSLFQGLVINSPSGIWYSDVDIRPAIIELRFIEGELESLAGLIDSTCFYKTPKSNNIFLSTDAKTNGNVLCVGNDCRELLCSADINLRPGNYYISANYRNGKVSIVT